MLRSSLILAILLGVAQLALARGVLRDGWRQGVVTAGAVLMLALPFPSLTALAQKKVGPVPAHEPRQHWRAVLAESPAEFRSVLSLQMDIGNTRIIEHWLYLGQDRGDNAVFITMRDVAVDFLLATNDRGAASVTLQAWDGHVWENIEVNTASFFPVAGLDFHGIALVKSADLELNGFTPVQLASFPRPGTPTNQLSYLEDQLHGEKRNVERRLNDPNDDPNDDAIIVAVGEDQPPPDDPPWGDDQLPQDLPQDPPWDKNQPPPAANEEEGRLPPRGEISLFWLRCQAGALDRGAWLGTHSCVVPFAGAVTQGSVIFNSITGDAVGFNPSRVELDPKLIVVSRDMVLSFSPDVLNQVEAMVSVSPHGNKLPVSWGALKDKR